MYKYKKPVVLFETENTHKGYDKLFEKFAVCYNDKDKRKYLKHFKKPTCTSNPTLVKRAIYYDSLVS